MRLIPFLALSLATIAAGMGFSNDSGKPVLSWDDCGIAFDRLEIRVSSAPFEAEAAPRGAVIARIEADSLTGEFPSSVELAGSFAVEPDICIGCGICVQTCPVDAIELQDGKAWIDPEICIACGLCASACPVDAILAPSESSHFALFGLETDGSATLLESI